AIHAYGKQIEVETGGGVGDFGEGPTEPVNGDWGPVIRYAAQLMDVPVDDSGVNLLKAQIKLESGGNEQILGGDDGLADGRATGLLQYKPGTFNKYAVEGHKNILSGFDQLLAFFNIPNALGQISGTHGWSPHGAPRSRTIIKQPAKTGGWGWPFPNNKSYTLGVGYKFGYDGGFRQNSYHDGTDWSSVTYSGDVHAIHPGVVTLVDGYNFGTGSGRIVVRGDDGYTVVYQEWTWAGSSGAHVSVGQRINIGDVICTLQASHVHIGVTTKDFATAFSNSFSNAGGWVDPIPLIQKGGSSASPAVTSQPATQTQSRAQEVIAYAERYVGQPYKWGGPRGVDQIVPTDCSGMTSNIYKHFGITIGGVTYTQATCGRRISRSEVQTGDLGFYDPGCHHVVTALDNKRAIQEPQPGQNCNIFNIDSYAPTYWIRNDQMAALVAGGGNASGVGGNTGGEKQMVYSCETDYISPLAKKVNIGERWADPIESDTITDEAQLKEWAKSQLHDYPDVEYSVDWISFTKNVGGFVNDASLGNYGWLRDRYGLDVKVRIKGYTRYADDSDPSNADSITFGNGAKALRDINSMLIGDLKPVKQAATKTNDKVSNGLRISATNQEWINSQLALTGGF
ncbi:MAG: phage tail protein, partial [Limosilactobacillus sp.]|nr:phage tail protein [Limosilactobacillus sp.]